ncbi:MAG: 2-isopropylmalate synthase [Deltaproteobacteria bacterium]|nr:2-isopropylmalate synthase [Deltaproteobacteria bacterium]
MIAEHTNGARRAGASPVASGFALQDVDEPNLLREMFPYDAPPRIVLDGSTEPLDPAPAFYITDTTFRDGQQARPPYTVRQILDLYRMLHRLGGPNGIIRQAEFFLYSDVDRAAVEQCLALGYSFPEVTGWIRAVASDFRLVKEMGLEETGILTSCSDYHIFRKLKKTRREALDDYLRIVQAALDAGVRIRCHLEDATRADFYGFVAPFVCELMRLSEASGMPIKIRVCDTLGFGVPLPGVALPRSVPKLIQGLRRECGVPSDCLEWHGHNDFHKVLANASAAWLYGCMYANGTLLGLGERTGNPPVEGLVMEYISLTGDANGMDTSVITEIGEYFERELNYRIPPSYPFVGRDFNVTRAGIHADGLLKDEEIYNVFDTTAVLGRPPRVAIDKTSGTAGVSWWINSYFHIPATARVDKKSDAVKHITEWVDDQYRHERTTSISDEELLAQVRVHLPSLVGNESAVAGTRVVSHDSALL